MENRSDWVDYAKAIGIILVVYGHVARGLYNAGISMPVELYKLIDSIVYSFHMPLFFFLSGLFFFHSFSKKGAKKLIFSKVDTLFYPYLVWSILQGCIEAFLSSYTNGTLSYGEVFGLLWAPRAQFWFLYALFTIFIASSAIFSVVPKRLSVFVFLFSIALYLSPIVLFDLQVYRFLSQNLVFFLFGVIFTMYSNVNYLSNKLPLLGALIAFIVGQWLFNLNLSLEYVDQGIASLLVAFTSIIFVISVSGYLSNKSYKFFALIGSYSMAIYLMHILVGSGLRIILGKLFGIDIFIVHLLLGCLIGVLAPLAIMVVINKMKIPYVLYAPVSDCIMISYNKGLKHLKR